MIANVKSEFQQIDPSIEAVGVRSTARTGG